MAISQAEMDSDKTIARCLMFSSETTFRTSHKINRHNLHALRVGGLGASEGFAEGERLLCLVIEPSLQPVSLASNTVNKVNCLELLQLTEQDSTLVF